MNLHTKMDLTLQLTLFTLRKPIKFIISARCVGFITHVTQTCLHKRPTQFRNMNF